MAPCRCRLEKNSGLDHRNRRWVGGRIGPPELAEYAFDFGEGGQFLVHLLQYPGRLADRHAGRLRGPRELGLFGMTVPEAIKEKSRAELLLGMGTLGRHGKFAPYVAGESFTLADLYFMYSLSLACGVGEKLFGLDLLEQLPKAKALLARLNEMPNAQKVEADRQAAMPAFMAMIAAKK